jgi:integrase
MVTITGACYEQTTCTDNRYRTTGIVGVHHNQCKTTKHWQIFYEIMWQTGERVGEVLRLSKRDIDNGGVWITSEKRIDKLRELVPSTPDFYRTLQDVADKHRESQAYSHILLKRPGWPLERLPKMLG